MLQLTHLAGFAALSSTADVTPNPFSIPDIANAGFVASAQTSPVTITGIDTTIILRLTLSAPLSAGRTIAVYRDATLAAQADIGSTIDVTLGNGQSLAFELVNAIDLSTWSGSAALTNLADANATLASFAFSLHDTGSGGGGGGGGGEPP